MTRKRTKTQKSTLAREGQPTDRGRPLQVFVKTGVEPYRKPTLKLPLLRTIPRSHDDRQLWLSEVIHLCEENKLALPTEAAKNLQLLVELHRGRKIGDAPVSDAPVLMDQVASAIQNLNPFPAGDALRERRAVVSQLAFLAFLLFDDREFEWDYAQLFFKPEEHTSEAKQLWDHAYSIDRRVVLSELEWIALETHIYLLAMELLSSFPTRPARHDYFVDLVRHYPWYMHTDFAVEWCHFKRLRWLRTAGPDAPMYDKSEFEPLAAVLLGTPGNFKTKRLRTTRGPHTSSFRIALGVKQLLRAKGKKADLWSVDAQDAYREMCEELGVPVEQRSAEDAQRAGDVLPRGFERLRNEGAKAYRRLEKRWKTEGNKLDSDVRLTYLKRLFGELDKVPLAYLNTRLFLYQSTLSIMHRAHEENPRPKKNPSFILSRPT